MDIVSHAVAGACTGAAFGRPILGAVFGVLPDVVIATKSRLQLPTEGYNFTHSLTFLLFFGLMGGGMFQSWVPFLALLSHLVLDIPTHGRIWAPPLLYPFNDRRFSLGEEWEWFNASWLKGLTLTIIWSGAWLAVSSQ